MTGLCLVAGLLFAPVGDAVTLSWTHSIEKIVWEEDYRRDGDAIRLTEARVRGTGAGMEPPEGAVLRDGAWHYRPALPRLPNVQLHHSPYVTGYTLCSTTRCAGLAEWLPGLPADTVVHLQPCEAIPAATH